MPIFIYYSSITATTSLAKHQEYIFNRLDGKKIEYQLVDLAQDSKLKDEMRSKIGNPDAKIPQIFNGDHYCGGYEDFEQAVECEMIEKFLKLDSDQQKK
ncbi:SH3 domain-binding glutamic acid-rich-like protein 3 [Amblyraja radiata]|uniref:SH3 domain-binding glutamic acid-rich-like protein 3 n=1 Tax=Amblyraja radiata TaxID=386614 RepID=UPI001401FC13|nr:SH3 domain-binding glutamic acid-rich-like protein 3 [Amblyraja radiata]